MILRNLPTNCILLHLLTLSICLVYGNVKTFNYKLNTLMIYKEKIYVGGANKISRLNTNLDILAETSNGPVNNSKYCYPSSLDKQQCVRTEKKYGMALEDNINKILLYSEKPIEMIIACGSVYQGICQFLDVNTLKNISAIYKESVYTSRIVSSEKYISSNGPDASATAFISYSDSGAFLVNAKTITIKPLITVPAISALPLGLELTEDQFLVTADPKLKIEYKGEFFYKNSTAMYTVNYKSSFSLDGFIYFTTNQANSESAEPPTIAHIIEIKFDKVALTGYVEMPLHCKENGILYNDIVSSTVIQLNSSDIVSNVAAGESVLFGVFMNTALGKFAICSFPIKELQRKTEGIREKCRKKESDKTELTKTDNVPWSPQKNKHCVVSLMLLCHHHKFLIKPDFFLFRSHFNEKQNAFQSNSLT